MDAIELELRFCLDPKNSIQNFIRYPHVPIPAPH